MGSLLAPLALALLAPALAGATPPAHDVDADVREIGRVQKELTGIEERLQLVEKQYAFRKEPGEEEALRHRHSDAEIQYLLNNYPTASVLFYDLVGNPAFRAMREYTDALFMLGESLYQQQSYMSARGYYREHMNLRGGHYREALERYLEISGRLNEFAGIESYIDKAKGPSGTLSPDLAYVYGKWLFRRTDISEKERVRRAQAVFASVADQAGPFAIQSAYFLGVIAVQSGDLEGAVAQFERVLKFPAQSLREKTAQEYANLSLGRVYFELGRFTEALDRYQEIDYKSENFVDALYEIAWTHVRRARTAGPAEYEKANQACEKLLLAAPDSILAPEARILQGHLLLKLGKYQEANEAYTAVINTYLEIYDNIDGRLKAHPDPVRYFQELISDSGKAFDISVFLPPVAAKWATTQRDVADAVRMTADIDFSKKSVVESNEIAQRLLDLLDTRSLDVFPQYQEGLTRADAVDSALAQAERDLLAAEKRLLGPERLSAIQKDLQQAQAEREALEARFKALPKNESELEARRARMSEEMGRLDQELYKLGYQLESLFAVLAAVEKYMADTRDSRPRDLGAEKEFADRMVKEREVAGGLRDELAAVQRNMRNEKAHVGMAAAADADLRAKYEQALKREKGLMAGARTGLPAPIDSALRGLDEARVSVDGLKARSNAAKAQIRDAVKRLADAMRGKVRAETELLKGYASEVNAVSYNAQDLVGAIAYESFKKVRKQFYDLVLKADVGLVDVAWTRKQEKTGQIQNLAKEKERELKGLDEEFKEVLKDVD